MATKKGALLKAVPLLLRIRNQSYLTVLVKTSSIPRFREHPVMRSS